MIDTSSDHAALRFACQEGGALCTVVEVVGSWSRRVGAQLAVSPDGDVVGDLSDRCMVEDIRKRVASARRSNSPQLVRYGQGAPEIDYRLPCASAMTLLIDPNPDRDELAAALGSLDRRMRASITLPHAEPKLLGRRTYHPRLRALCFGEEEEAQQIRRIGEIYGAEVKHCSLNGLSSAPCESTDQWTAIVCLYHDHDWELGVLPWALSTDAFYIGAVGGKVAREVRTRMLVNKGISETRRASIRQPIGIFPRALNSRSLAISIMAELVMMYEAKTDQ